jgi:uncharacterized protein with PQ loop repeat
MYSSNSSSSSSSAANDAPSVGGGDEPAGERSWSFIVGTALGYVSSVLYLCSRVSQIYKNWTRKSAEGLALVMFIMAACANLCTGSGIIMRTFTWRELREQLPWIIGSLGTITLDMVILVQSGVYAKGTGLLPTAVAVGPGGDGAAVERGHTTAHHSHHPRHHIARRRHHVDDEGAAGALSDGSAVVHRRHQLDRGTAAEEVSPLLQQQQ